MSRLLVLGVGPLPIDRSQRLHAPGVRTWQFAESANKQRHSVVLGMLEFGDEPEAAGGPVMVRREEINETMGTLLFRNDPERIVATLEQVHRMQAFHAVISTSDLMAGVAAALPANIPKWFDYNGDPFAEKQLQGTVYDSDAAAADQWGLFYRGLRAGDKFSAATEEQKAALTGQLALVGRITGETAEYELVHAIANCSRVMRTVKSLGGLKMRPQYFPSDGFVTMWTGGYNCWADPDTLWEGLQMAFRKDRLVFFASTGGAIQGHDTKTFKRFESATENTEWEPRVRFLGWVETADMPGLYAQASAALNVDRPCYEGELGARTRIGDWIEFGIPVITTTISPLARELARHDLVYAFEAGNPASLCDAILRCKEDGPAAALRAEDARRYFNTHYAEEKVLAPLLDWAAKPQKAPDLLARPEGRAFGISDALAPMMAGLGARGEAAPAAPRKRGLLSRLLRRG